MKDKRAGNAGANAANSSAKRGASPGKTNRVQKRYARTPVQAKAGSSATSDGEAVAQHAAAGVSGSGSSLPHGDAIQASFGSHDVSSISAHVGGAAATASEAIGAQAYATGESVAFKSTPDLHTAAHEAAHVVQQRAGVSLPGGVGRVGDSYERHADSVADAVVSGNSAEGLLNAMSGGGSSSVQRQVQRSGEGEGTAAATPAAGAGDNAGAPAGGDVAADPHAALIAAVDAGNFATALNEIAPPPGTCSEKPVRGLAALQAAGKRAAFFTGLRGAKPYSDEQRAQLYDIYHSLPFNLKKLLFEARFSVALGSIPDAAGTTTEFTEQELNTLHDQAHLLPGGHVEGLATFTALRRTTNARARGSYGNPNVNMDAQTDATSYSGTFRHEVGHAVDAALGGTSNDFRIGQAGWNRYANVAGFIAAMGGYGALPAALQPRLDAAIQAYLGPGNTFAAPTATFEETLEATVMAAHPSVIASAADGSDAVSREMTQFRAHYDSSPPLQVMIACQGDNNYWRYNSWHVTSGKAFFVNHWYARPYSIAASTHSDLSSWPSNSSAQKAAFSDAEWFAETYSVWYSTAEPGTSHQWAGFVKTFFEGPVATLGAPGQAPSGGGGNPQVP